MVEASLTPEGMALESGEISKAATEIGLEVADRYVERDGKVTLLLVSQSAAASNQKLINALTSSALFIQTNQRPTAQGTALTQLSGGAPLPSTKHIANTSLQTVGAKAARTPAQLKFKYQINPTAGENLCYAPGDVVTEYNAHREVITNCVAKANAEASGIAFKVENIANVANPTLIHGLAQRQSASPYGRTASTGAAWFPLSFSIYSAFSRAICPAGQTLSTEDIQTSATALNRL